MTPHPANISRLPSWLKKKAFSGNGVHEIKKRLRAGCLHTVCEEARCPNIGECLSRGTATFLIMGNICTRRCGFCAIAKGAPDILDADEPRRVAREVKALSLAHAVITSVTRDDLKDGGALHFARTIEAIRKSCPKTTTEVLTPDFEGREADIATVCGAHPDIFNHNIETVERLTPQVRDRADYRRSLDVLKTARLHLPRGIIKSGFMLGLGETAAEVRQTMGDIKGAGCEILTIGQYLRPSKNALPVKEYLEENVFFDYKAIGYDMGFKYVFAGPFVRSSYMAEAAFLAESRARA